MAGFDIQHLMRQARKLEKAMEEARGKLGELTVDGESGGGLVKVRMDGRCNVLRIEIDPRALEPFGSAERRAEAQPQHALEPFGSAERRAEAQPQHALEPFGSAERRAEAQPQHALEPFGSAERRAEAQPQHGIDPGDRAMLEDLLTAAVNAAAEKARAAAEESIQKATGGVKMPGLPY